MKKIFKKAISIRLVHILMLVCAAVIVLLLVFSTRQSSSVFSMLSSETENYIVRQKAAHDLMEASDFLTENVQRFTLDGDTKYLNQYFEEAYTSKRRESAIMTMSSNHADEGLVQQLQEALDESMHLMYREYYAMKLVVDAKEITRYPDAIKAIELTDEDAFLSADEKMELAQKMVMDNEYYASKEIIRTKLKNALELLDDQMAATRRKTNDDMMKDLTLNRTVVIILVVVLAALMALTAGLATVPLIGAHKAALKQERLPVTGSKELRTLSEKYNEMYDALHPEDEE